MRPYAFSINLRQRCCMNLSDYRCWCVRLYKLPLWSALCNTHHRGYGLAVRANSCRNISARIKFAASKSIWFQRTHLSALIPPEKDIIFASKWRAIFGKEANKKKRKKRKDERIAIYKSWEIAIRGQSVYIEMLRTTVAVKRIWSNFQGRLSFRVCSLRGESTSTPLRDVIFQRIEMIKQWYCVYSHISVYFPYIGYISRQIG